MQTTPYTPSTNGDPGRSRAELRRDIAKRLENVCADWPAEEFERIVDQVTDTTIKYAEPLHETDG